MATRRATPGGERRLFAETADWATMRARFRWAVPDQFSIAERCCDSWAAEAPDRTALVALDDQGGRHDWSYGALKRASDGLALAFAAAGIGRGDRIGILLPQGPAVLITHFAAMKLGAIALPLFTLFGPDALAFRLADSGARAVVSDGANLDKLMALRSDCPDLAAIWCLDPAPVPVRAFWGDIEAARGVPERLAIGAEDPAVMIYTSGTTGPPKGCLHAHRFLLGHLPSMELTHEGFPRPGACGWTPADWAWIGGLMDMAMPCLYYGVPLVSRRMRRFDPEEAYRLIRDTGATNLFLPPTALKMMRAAPVPAGLGLRAVSSGGEALGADLLDWGREALGAPINELYGQTECNLMITQAAGFMVVKPGTMGQPLPGFDVAVLDTAGQPSAQGEIGEIAVRRGTPAMFLRYWQQPEKTAAKFRGDWMMTGDLGRADADGYVTFVARDDDIISSAGYRIGPSEIEACLSGHPDVVMAACVGMPDPLRGEVVKAFVVLRDGASWEGLEAALIARVRERISPHVAPRAVERRDVLPMTATGKIQRRDLREE
ncbi:MAG: AMP-binding protein [Paracoccaceae bacterium]